jgi:hypothetical protein
MTVRRTEKRKRMGNRKREGKR